MFMPQKLPLPAKFPVAPNSATWYIRVMIQISEEIEQEIQRRLADGQYPTADDLLRHALLALDGGEAMEPWLEAELLKGLEGEDVEVTPEELDAVQREALTNVGLS